MATNQIRIIGGHHRGRKLGFPDVPGLRPSGDRVRETLFNWLAPVLPGGRCLDLFAGSGALGLEAASRGAGEVLLVERNPVAARALRDNVALLRLERVRVIEADAMTWLAESPGRFDVVFLDPPFADRLLGRACAELVGQDRLAPAALVYLEADLKVGLPTLPTGLRLVKDKRAGLVTFGLARWESAPSG